MIWLLGEITASLVLAALLGWFIGWTMQGFRARDRVEDLRRQLNTTAEIKERELVEAYRQSESLQTRMDVLERQRNRLEDELEAALVESALPLPSIVNGGATESAGTGTVETTPPAAEPVSMPLPEPQSTGELQAAHAEIDSLRAAIDRKAMRIAELETRLLELEPARERLAEREERVRGLRRESEELRTALESAHRAAESADQRLEEARERLRDRDVRVNEFRSVANDARAALERAQAESTARAEALARCEGLLARRERELEQARCTVQRQLERIRKQEQVHRSVVDNLSAQPIRDRMNRK